MGFFCPNCGFENTGVFDYCRGCRIPLDMKEDSDAYLLNYRYRLLSSLGRGGMSVVYKAQDTRSDNIFAIKEMDDGRVKRDEDRRKIQESFIKEAKILYRLEHPGLPKVIDFFTRKVVIDASNYHNIEIEKVEKNRYFLVMSFIDGQNFKQIMTDRQNKPFPEKDCLDWFLRITEILQYLHSQNPPIIYRDMKPSNVMISKEGEIFLVDFGIARIFQPQSDRTSMGTYGYSPPEQYEGIAGPRSDIYSLGVTFFCLMTGIFPESGPTAINSVNSIRDVNQDISKEMESLIIKMIQTDREKRPGSMEDIKKALLDIKEKYYTVGGESSGSNLLDILKKPLSLSFLGKKPSPKSAEHKKNRGRLAEFLSKSKPWDCIRILKGHDDSVRDMVFSPDGSCIVSVSDDGFIKLWNIETGKCLKTLQAEDGLSSVSLSPDGKILAVGCRNQTIEVWNLEKGERTNVLKGHFDSVSSVVFSQDIRRLASGSGDKTIKIWDIVSGVYIKNLAGGSGGILSVALSPDSKWVASGCDDEAVRLWDIVSGRCIRILKGHIAGVNSVCFSPDGQLIASGANDKTVRIWDIPSGKCIQTLKEHQGFVYAVSFHPNGQWVASCSDDNTVKIWDINSSRCEKTLKGHSEWVLSTIFSPDGNFIASCGDDQTVRIWVVE